MRDDERYLAAIQTLGEHVRRVLARVSGDVQRETTEIRLRVGRPLGLITPARILFVDEHGGIAPRPVLNAFIVTKADMQDCFVSLCGWAVHSHQREMADGYIAVRGGHRAGVAATAVVEDGLVASVRDITSINLRIAREIFGCADQLIRGYFMDRPCGLLLAGAPASGKTTLLRDLARQLSSGTPGVYRKVCVVDESGEIGASSGGLIQNDLGPCCDLLAGYPKAKGLQIAIRYLSPEIIICDEIATEAEIEAVAAAVNSGVAVVTSVHAASFEELYRKRMIGRLFETGAFAYAAMLRGADKPAQILAVRKVEELCIQP